MRKAKSPRKSPEDTGSWKPAFLAALRNSGNIRAAAQAAKVSRGMVYKEREECPEFREAWDLAREEAVELLEAACRQRALKGSDLLMMFLLKAARPEIYRDRHDVRLDGKLEQEIVVDLVTPKESDD